MRSIAEGLKPLRYQWHHPYRDFRKAVKRPSKSGGSHETVGNVGFQPHDARNPSPHHRHIPCQHRHEPIFVFYLGPPRVGVGSYGAAIVIAIPGGA